MKNTQETCSRCIHWDWPNNRCLRVVAVKLVIGNKGGSIDIQTQPGVIPKELEERLEIYLADVLVDIIDSWKGWKEIDRTRDCAAREERHDLKEFCNVIKFPQ